MPEGAPIPRTDTLPQRRLHGTLRDMGFDVEDEVPVGRYSLDCYVRELHLGFEADGPKHRGTAARRRDEVRDAWIEACAGIPVLRVAAAELGSEALRHLSRVAIRAFIDSWGDSADERRACAEVLV